MCKQSYDVLPDIFPLKYKVALVGVKGDMKGIGECMMTRIYVCRGEGEHKRRVRVNYTCGRRL